jgi:hypothetical protein
MSKEDRVVVDLKWLATGEKDPHPRYVEIQREDLAGAHLLSDDELAYSLSMMSTISDEEDTRRMMQSHRTDGAYIHKSLLGEIAKDRIRWLSRRVAVLEGRYPNTVAEQQGTNVLPAGDKRDPYEEAVAEARLERQVPLLVALLGLTAMNKFTDLPRILEEKKFRVDPSKVGIALGYFLTEQYTKRWHAYVALARDLLKQGVYIPFWDDEFDVGAKNVLTIAKSKYYNTSRVYTVRAWVAGQATEPLNLIPEGTYSEDKQYLMEMEAARCKAEIEKRAETIYDSWKDVEGWVPWVPGGNSNKQGEARMLATEAVLGEYANKIGLEQPTN